MVFGYRQSRALFAFVVCGAFAASLAACGGGGSSSGGTLPIAQPTALPTATATAGRTQAATAQVEFIIQWPSTGASSAKRTRNYLSPSTASITIAGTGFTTVEVDNPNINKSASPSPSTTQTVVAPVGSDTFTVTDYDALGGMGHELAANSVQATIVMDQANVVPITLNGNLASIVCAPVTPNVFDTVSGTNGAYTQIAATGQIVLMAEDAGSNIIVAPGAIPTLTLAATTPSQATISPFGGTTNEFNISPTTAVGVLVPLTATGTNLLGTMVTNTSCSDTLGGIYHPGDNEDTFSMNGTLLVTYNRANEFPTPEPTSTTLDTVTQTIIVTNPATFQGTAAVEFGIAESDTQTAPAPQSFDESINQYYQYSNSMYDGNFLDLGYTVVDDTNYTVTQVNGTGDQLADELPEITGASWTNNAARTVTTNDGNGETSATTYAADGSYTGTVTYQNLNPAPNPTGTPQLTNVANLTTKTDGSALLVTPRDGTELQYNSTYTFNAPTVSGPTGTITVNTLLAPAAGSTSTPAATSTTVPNWMPAMVPGSLTSETDVDNGPVALPSPCAAAKAIPGSPNQVVQTKTNVDPLNGVLDVTTTTTYDTLNVGPVCVVYHDVATNYYDLSGANGAFYFFGIPLQVTTTDEVLTLSHETLQTIARHPAIDSRTALMRSVNVALGRGRLEAAKIKTRQRALDALVHRRSFKDTLRTPGASK